MSALPALDDAMRFRDLVAARLGLHFDDTKLLNLATLLGARCGGDSTRYLAALGTMPAQAGELYQLAAALTVTETYFYRAIDQIRAFAEFALPARLALLDGQAPIRVLSAGCASGEEPYTMAMAAREAAPQCAQQLVLTAIDANPAMLDKARRARYGRWAMRDLPEATRARWFRADGDSFVLDESICKAVSFSQRNLAQEDAVFWGESTLDIVFCRNVLMYFTPAQAQAAVARIARALVPGGFLFLGHAETLRGLSTDFHLCHTHETFYYQRKPVLGQSEEAPPLADLGWKPRPGAPAPGDTGWIDAIGSAARRIDALAAAAPRAAAAAPAAATPDLQHALASLHSEQFAHSLDLIERLPAQFAADPDVLLLKAATLCQSGAAAAAETVCQQLLGLEEFNAGAHYVLALCREQHGDIHGARTHYQSAAYLDPGFALARLRLGLLERRQSRLEAARRELDQALRLLQQEEASRLLLFGGGFTRETLIGLCRAELAAFGVPHGH